MGGDRSRSRPILIHSFTALSVELARSWQEVVCAEQWCTDTVTVQATLKLNCRPSNVDLTKLMMFNKFIN